MKNQAQKLILLKRMAEIKLELTSLQQKFKEITKQIKDLRKNAVVRKDSKKIEDLRKKIVGIVE
jgi:predicted  nucleic acid-binding Zn-ribbon protein